MLERCNIKCLKFKYPTCTECGRSRTHPHVQISQMHFSSGAALIDGRLLAAAGDDDGAVFEASADVEAVFEAPAAATASDVEDATAAAAVFTADDDVRLCTVVVEEDTDVLDVVDVFLTANSVLFELIVMSHCRASIFTTELPYRE